jgi:hypothetical protein
MRLKNEHPPDCDLVMLLDGELEKQTAARTRGHIGTCWQCRTRIGELEGAVAGYIQTRRAELDGAVPPSAAPRAMFRARLEELAASQNADGNADRRKIWRWIPAATMVLAAAALSGVFVNTLRGDASSPLRRLTPGETRPIQLSEVCGANFHEETVRQVSEDVRKQVFAEYGVRGSADDAYEVDYLITPGLGGADTIRNMWPQPYSARWNAKVKDQLEDHLHSLVCSGRIDLATAQREIATDWIAAYKKYFRTSNPL